MRMLRSVVRCPPARSLVTVQNLVTVALALCCWAVAAEVTAVKTTRSYNKQKAEPPARPNSYLEERQAQPVFDNTTERNVSTQLGKTAYLHCSVKNLGDRTVSWIRHRDLHILTVGRYTYTSDQRFQVIHLEQRNDWTLQIKYPGKNDAGSYECQVSTEPKISMFVNLNVLEENFELPPSSSPKPPIRRSKIDQVAKATILGAPDLYIKSGSTINLTCIITQSPQAPTFLFWYHNDKVINFNSNRGGVSLMTEKGDTTKSNLLVTNVNSSDSGNYTCNPSNADLASIMVHVLNGEKPAAMQHGGQSRLLHDPAAGIRTLCVGLMTLFFTVVPVVR